MLSYLILTMPFIFVYSIRRCNLINRGSRSYRRGLIKMMPEVSLSKQQQHYRIYIFISFCFRAPRSLLLSIILIIHSSASHLHHQAIRIHGDSKRLKQYQDDIKRHHHQSMIGSHQSSNPQHQSFKVLNHMASLYTLPLINSLYGVRSV